MARPQRNNVDYFPFYCEEGKKMFYLEETYGNDGFATFVKILRELAKSDYHYLDLSKATTMMFLSAKCKISKEVLEAIIKDLVDLEKFDYILWNENKIIWCQDFTDSIQDAYAKRKNDCITYESLLLLLISLGVRKPIKVSRKPSKSISSSPVNTQTILEDTIQYKNKENIDKASPFSFYNSLLNLGCDKQLLSDWLKVRKTKKATNSQTAFNGFVKQVGLAKITYNEALEICATNSWAGFKNEWYQNVKNQNNEQRINNSNTSFGNQSTSRVSELEELVRRNSSPPNN